MLQADSIGISEMKHQPHVALLIEASREYARGLLRGVANYHESHGPWSIFFTTRGLSERLPKWLKSWKGDGILARINDQRMADAILGTGIPAIDLRGAIPDLGLPFIGVDNRLICEMAFQHLADCGVKHFAFCGTPRNENRNQDFRCDYFVQLVEAAGPECHVCLGLEKKGKKFDWEKEQQFLAEWIISLPKPIGLMTCHDDRGQQILDACRRAEIAVPDEVAVISVDNDANICNLCTPPLTSIDVHPSRVGYEAAAMLDRMMQGQPAITEPLLIGPPRGVAARKSTDMLSLDDPEVQEAVRFVRENAVKGIRVRDVVARSKLSMGTLERRVKKELGRTIKAEIIRVRMTRAKLLLTETELPISQVAYQVGIGEPKYFCEVFRKLENMTATEFRLQFRSGP